MTLVSVHGEEKYLAETLKKNMDGLKELVKKKWDGVGFICGYEGDGKSTLASQMAYYLDSTYNLDRCVFTGRQFLEAVDKAKKFECIVFDEAHNAFANTNRYEEVNKIIISKLTMIRKKQLFILIVAPTFFSLNKYLVVHRARFMIHVYSKGLQRGFLRFFNREVKHYLYIRGKKDENMYSAKPNFTTTFTGWFPLVEEAYESKKDEATEELDAGINGGSVREQRNKLLYLYFEEPKLTVDNVSVLIGLDGSSINRIRRRGKVLGVGGGNK